MNGFVHCFRSGLMLCAVAAVAGCHTLDHRAAQQAGCPSGACPTQGCGRDGCSAGSFCSRCKEKLRNFDWEQLHPDHCWPEQYSREAQRRLNGPFGEQMMNGNAVELTIWDHYFSTDEGKAHELTQAGESRLRYLARKRPYVIPNLRLESSFDRDLDEQRISTLIAAANRYSLEPVGWHVVVINQSPTGLYGPEGPKAINKMIGPAAGPPFYEQQIKQTFRQQSGAR